MYCMHWLCKQHLNIIYEKVFNPLLFNHELFNPKKNTISFFKVTLLCCQYYPGWTTEYIKYFNILLIQACLLDNISIHNIWHALNIDCWRNIIRFDGSRKMTQKKSSPIKNWEKSPYCPCTAGHRRRTSSGWCQTAAAWGCWRSRRVCPATGPPG